MSHLLVERREEKCEACGEPHAELKKYRGKHLCPRCLKQAKEARKKPCPFCGNRYVHLKRHLEACDRNPANQAPETPALTAGALHEEIQSDATVQALHDEVATLRGQVRALEKTMATLESRVNVEQTLEQALPKIVQAAVTSLEPPARADGQRQAGDTPARSRSRTPRQQPRRAGTPRVRPPSQGSARAARAVSRRPPRQTRLASRPLGGPVEREFHPVEVELVQEHVDASGTVDWHGVYSVAAEGGWTLNYFVFLEFLVAAGEAGAADAGTEPAPGHPSTLYEAWLADLARNMAVLRNHPAFSGPWADFVRLGSPGRNKRGPLTSAIVHAFAKRANAPAKSRDVALAVLADLGRPRDSRHVREIQNAVQRLVRRGTVARDEQTYPARYYLADTRPLAAERRGLDA